MTGADWFWWLLVAGSGLLLWQHDRISRRAYQVARQHTQKNGVLLLDQSVVLKSLKPRLSKRDGLHWQRRFDFEFSTRGDVRYRGYVCFRGRHIYKFHMQPFRPVEDDAEQTQ